MSVALALEPYEFSQDHGPDDLSDVDLNHPNFRAAFPDGIVPIVEVPMPRGGLGDGFHAWATNVLTVHEHTLGFDVDALAHARERLVSYEVLGGDQAVDLTSASLLERKGILSELLVGGLTMRQAARYLGWTDADTVECATSAVMRENAERVLMVDEALAEGDESQRRIAARCGIKLTVVQCLGRLRKGEPYQARRDCVRAEAA